LQSRRERARRTWTRTTSASSTVNCKRSRQPKWCNGSSRRKPRAPAAASSVSPTSALAPANDVHHRLHHVRRRLGTIPQRATTPTTPQHLNCATRQHTLGLGGHEYGLVALVAMRIPVLAFPS